LRADAQVTGVRFWSLEHATRVAVEVNSDFGYRWDRLANPDRIFFDIVGVRPSRIPKGIETILVSDPRVEKIRIAETVPGTTRIVLDLAVPGEFSASRLLNPNRLIIEVRAANQAPESPLPETTQKLESPAATPRMVAAVSPKSPGPKGPALLKPTGEGNTRPTVVGTAGNSAVPLPRIINPAPATGAKRTSSGQSSLTRALGLKLARVVLDPGHGGHDTGTIGATGLLEKDLVLDVARRLSALIEERLGSEVLLTRTADEFVPLEERTRIANDHRADLFLSIHANSSPLRSTSGVETYYLSLTNNSAELEVAARENASSERSIYELRELVQKIALKDKVDESKEFAGRIQTSLSLLAARSNSRSKNRGVRKAPFVVLIGASMPSVLAEIGFVTNPQDEKLMKKPPHREKIAEALYKGIAQYASGLSHFQVARQGSTSGGE
jgi:N-acetylmuramoyl-L-alanine amidase